MKYVVLKNFIDNNQCKKLIDDGNKHLNFDKHVVIHKNRVIVNGSNKDFNYLIEKSDVWDNFEKKINSQDFLDFCLKKVKLDSSKYCLKNFFKIRTPSSQEEKYKKICNTKTKVIPTIPLLKYLLFRIYRNILRKIKFSKIFYPKESPVELLYDFSRAGNGYSIEPHRDSDSRLLVFLLFLNSFSEDNGVEGGKLHFHELIDKSKDIARPKLESCKLIDTIKPEAGTLVIFSNEDDSYHSVSEMKNSKDYRYFMYGGFTLLSQKNPNIKGNKQDTTFELYE